MYPLILLILLMSGLVETSNAATSKPVSYDIIVCLDDRIAQPEQVKRDKAIILAAFQEFKKLVRQKRFYIKSNDQFRVLICPQNGNDPELLHLAKSLHIDMSQLKVQEKRVKMDDFEANLPERLESIYKLAYRGPQKEMYNGANIWRYFNGKYQDELHAGKETKIIILTDGYIDFERDELKLTVEGKTNCTDFVHKLGNNPQWDSILENEGKGLIPCQLDLSSATVFILELEPKGNGYFVGSILKAVWVKWLSAMGASTIRTLQRTTSLPDLGLLLQG